MDRKKLEQLWDDLEDAWRSPQTAADLAVLAKRCGRELKSGANHPMWHSRFPEHRAFPLASHGGNPTLGHHIRKVVLTALGADWEAWAEIVEAEEKKRPKDGER